VTRRGVCLLVAIGTAAVVASPACGKRGNPLPPLRPVPGPILDVTAHRSGDATELRWTIPATNADGTTPAAVTRIEVYGVELPEGTPAPPATVVLGDIRNRRGEVLVRRGPPGETQTTSSSQPPVAGGAATFVERLPVAPQRVMHYVVRGLAGGDGDREGSPSAVVSVPLGPIPGLPDAPALAHDERNVRVSWTVPAPGLQFRVATGERTATVAPAGSPLVDGSGTEVPVEFGRERCFWVATVLVAGPTTVEGPLSPAACITPVDRFPPPAPTGLEAVQSGGSVTLTWTAVSADDLAGYVVLRGEGAAETLVPLMRTPLTATSFTDTSVQTGVSYSYSVYAVDHAAVPNVSQQSNRETITVR
jgi:hypothetical protein